MTGSIEIRTVPWTHSDALTLRNAQQHEINGDTGFEVGVKATAQNVPIFLIAYDEDGTAVACGGLRSLDDQGLPGQAEIKRMFVVPGRRGHDDGKFDKHPSIGVMSNGSGRRILSALEQMAREKGWNTLKLETGIRLARARKFYEKNGFTLCDAFGSYVGCQNSVYYDKDISK